MQYPRITVVTPSYNQGKYIEETILSVLNQNYPNLEFIIIDGGSSDETVEIIKKYESRLAYWVSEKDKGQYDAVQKGLLRSTGEILTYLNSDDILTPDTFEIVLEIFEKFKQIDWLTGLGARIDEKSRVVSVACYEQWNKYGYRKKDHKYVQQEGTFWRKSLWDKAGSYISTEYDLASDMELWVRFFKHAQLYTVNIPTGYFRLRSENQKSLTQMDAYISEMNDVLKKNPLTGFEQQQLALYETTKAKKKFSLQNIFRSPKKTEADSYPPLVAFERGLQEFVLYQPE